MKCPKCGCEMTKARKAEVWLCPECGARARVVLDEPDEARPFPQIVPMPYPVEPWPKPVEPWTPIWYGPTTADPMLWARWTVTCATDSIPGIEVS